MTIQFVTYQNVPITFISNAYVPIAYNDSLQRPETPFNRHNKLLLYTSSHLNKRSLHITMAIILIKQLLYFRPIACNKVTPKHHAAQPAFQSSSHYRQCILLTINNDILFFNYFHYVFQHQNYAISYRSKLRSGIAHLLYPL